MKGRLRGFVREPSIEEIKELAAMEYLRLTDVEAGRLAEVIKDGLAAVNRLDELPRPALPVKWQERDPGYRPSAQEDPYNLFIRKCRVVGAPEGKLAGKRVALKNNIAVAGVPLTNGSRALHIVPEFDAAVVERLLDAGATIVGMLNQDDMSFCGTSETSSFGPVNNPLNPAFSPGGSSSGAGAVLLTGEADLALAVDNAGSARMPAAWTGVYTIKATHGLVPSFGIVHMDHTLDFVCPVTRSVRELAEALEVLAGEDERDPQWVRGPIQVQPYTEHLRKDVSGLRIGVVREAFGWDFSDPDVDRRVRGAVETLVQLGASAQDVSVPLWRDALPIWLTLTAHSVSAMIESDQLGYWHGGVCVPEFAEAFGRTRRLESDSFPPLVKSVLILGKYLRRRYYSAYFAKAQALRHQLRGQINRLLSEYDVLVTPTIAMKPFALITEDVTEKEWAQRAVANVHNTCPLNLTGHPALAVPCGLDERSLPTSLQLIGPHWNEGLLLRVAYTLEQEAGG